MLRNIYSSVCNPLRIRSHDCVHSSERRRANATLSSTAHWPICLTGDGAPRVDGEPRSNRPSITGVLLLRIRLSTRLETALQETSEESGGTEDGIRRGGARSKSKTAGRKYFRSYIVHILFLFCTRRRSSTPSRKRTIGYLSGHSISNYGITLLKNVGYLIKGIIELLM